MRMIDVKKAHRGVLLNREDIIKCERCAKTPLSERVRDLLHKDMGKFELDDEGKRILDFQIRQAMQERIHKNPKAGTRSVSRKHKACGYEDIPTTAIKGVKFIKVKGRVKGS